MPLTILTEQDPRLIIIDAPATTITIQSLTDQIKDFEDDNLSFAQLVKTSGKEDLGGGVSVGITAQLLNAQVVFEQRPVSLFGGVATTANSAGTSLTDVSSGLVNFTDIGVVPGDTIMNVTDRSVATILTVTGSTITHFALEDGADNDWDFADEYKIWSKVQCEINGGNLVAIDGLGASISALFPSYATHVIRTAASSATLINQEGSIPTVDQIADGVWDEVNADHLTAGSTGKSLSDGSEDSSTIASAVWNKTVAAHVTSGTFGKAMNDILQVNQGDWRIISNQLILYASDGSTPLFTFDLTDSGGSPSETSVTRRVRT